MTEATVVSSGVELDIAKARVGILSEENDRLQHLVSTLKSQLQTSQQSVSLFYVIHCAEITVSVIDNMITI